MEQEEKAIRDLGWINAGGETERQIVEATAKCKLAGHQPSVRDVGSYGTVHDTACRECGYLYHEDSSD